MEHDGIDDSAEEYDEPVGSLRVAISRLVCSDVGSDEDELSEHGSSEVLPGDFVDAEATPTTQNSTAALPSSTNAEEDADRDRLRGPREKMEQKLRDARAAGCCSARCLDKVPLALAVEFAADVASLPFDARSMLLRSAVMYMSDDPETTSPQLKKKKRERASSSFKLPSLFTDHIITVCRTAWLAVHGISEIVLRRLYHEARAGLVDLRQHGGVSRTPKHAVSAMTVTGVVMFLKHAADVFANPLPSTVSAMFPPHITKKELCGLYNGCVEADEALPGAVKVSRFTFARIWSEHLPLLGIAKTRSDMCDRCVLLRQQARGAQMSFMPDALETIKMDAALHRALALEHRTLYNMRKTAARQVFASIVTERGPLTDGRFPAVPASLATPVMYSFDFAESVWIPTLHDQPGRAFFMLRRALQIFGVCNVGLRRQINFIFDSDQFDRKGPSLVVSLLHLFFTQYSCGERDVTLYADNCAAQNKNWLVMAYLCYRVCFGLHANISIHFMIAGHTKFDCDGHFGMIKQRYHKSNCYDLDGLAEIISRSGKPGRNVPHPIADGQTVLHDWESALAPYFRRLPGISSFHHFEFRASNPGFVFCRESPTSLEESIRLLLPAVTSVPDVNSHPDAIPPLPKRPYDAKRHLDLYNNARQYVPDAYKDKFCPKPPSLA